MMAKGAGKAGKGAGKAGKGGKWTEVVIRPGGGAGPITNQVKHGKFIQVDGDLDLTDYDPDE